jgi:LacI family transcriptional regulator
MTTIQELAKRSGVSVATVSRALNGSSEVSDVTRDKILALARELEYTPSAAARSLVRRRSHVVGIVLETGAGHPDLLHPFFQEVLVGLKRGAGARGYDLLLFASEAPGFGFGGRQSYLRRCEHHGVDGVVVWGVDAEDPDVKLLAAAGMPCIAVDAELGGPRSGFVTSENREGAAAAVRHLHALGHERIATVSGPLSTMPGADRLEGYRAELERLGLEVREEYMLEGDFYDESGRAATQRLLALDEPPTAIFAASDLMAAGALRAANELGVRVPDDVAVVGFDDMDFARDTEPPLTTVRQPITDLGRMAARQVLRMAGNEQIEPVLLLPTELVKRESA